MQLLSFVNLWDTHTPGSYIFHLYTSAELNTLRASMDSVDHACMHSRSSCGAHNAHNVPDRVCLLATDLYRRTPNLEFLSPSVCILEV
ncbi:hypothetical protein EBI_22460 [Enterocytozoon bieneusi H348]|nr:hypothetical protein EBI_22460 [Enterocytozoon bieneusi H348]|eukprot:XP_002652140.1 hypothetical protein EBI_22460 [Enterocytozoon bieneusi H348]